MDDAPTTYGLKFQARALAAQAAETDCSRWFVGTVALREENEIHLVEFDGEEDTIRCVNVLRHPSEVWALSPSLTAPHQFLSIHNTGGTYGLSLWQFQEGSSELEELVSFSGTEGVLRSAMWNPVDAGQAISVEEGALRLWSLEGGKAITTACATADELQAFWGGTWSSVDPRCVVSCAGNGVTLWDVRTMDKTGEVESAHAMPVRDVDISRQNQNHMVTAGDDCKLRLWDVRKLAGGAREADNAGQPLLELGNSHSHWIWQSRFNPAHEELILSSSSDCQVNLWHMSFEENASPRAAGREDNAPVGGLAHSFDEHDDSVYGAAWSEADPWVFATLSYDGRLVVNRVPNATKYKILL